MNLFEKIQRVRVELASQDIKMTGYNKYADYAYFELDDFLTPVNALMDKYKMTAIPTFTADTAKLTVINSEKPEEQYTIESPMGTANLKGCHEVQNIGAVETYQRRYLYQALFDIKEKDELNATQGKPDTQKKAPPKAEPPKDTAQQPKSKARQIQELIKGTDIEPSQITDWIKGTFGEEIKVNNLTDEQFKKLYKAISEFIKGGSNE